MISFLWYHTDNHGKFFLDFCYCQPKKKKLTSRDYEFASVVGGISLVMGPLKQGSTVLNQSMSTLCTFLGKLLSFCDFNNNYQNAMQQKMTKKKNMGMV